MAELLLVDDDARISELVAWFLERRGHRVRRVTSYAAAREELARALPALMLADLDLGVESGREELPRLAALGLLPRTMVVSGYLDAALEAELSALEGVVGTLAKPFDVEVLVRRVGEALEAAPTQVPPPPAPEPDAWHDEDDEGWTVIGPDAGREPGGGGAP